MRDMKRLLAVGAFMSCAVLLLLPAISRATEEKRETLSVHETIARFDGIQGQPCMYKTALCPDRCGHAKLLAWFTILRYEKYAKPGQYGDEKTDRFAMPVSGEASPEMNPANAEIVKGLKPGAWVRLNWVHEYVTKDGCSYPERAVTRLERIRDAEVDALRKEIPEPPKRDLAPSPAAPANRGRMLR